MCEDINANGLMKTVISSNQQDESQSANTVLTSRLKALNVLLHCKEEIKEKNMWHQKIIQLKEKRRGFHLITDEVLSALPEMTAVNVGQLHLFLQHTSASLTLNENCDQTVRSDMEQYFLRTVPDKGDYQHDYEGADDMPAHIKSSLLGVSLLLPISQGRVLLGTWQGIWLGEHRIHGGGRRIIATLQGNS